MDRIEPTRPSLPPIDTTRVRRVIDERERAAAGQAEKQEKERRRRRQAGTQQSEGREWSTDEQDQKDREPDGPPRVDVRA